MAPHTDDAELGCGATIVKLIEQGTDVHIAVFSTAEESLPPGSAPTRLRDEFLEAIRVLGVPEANARVFNYPVRHLSYHRQSVLEQLVALRKELQPDAVFVPSGSDFHQDHQVLHFESVRAFKDRTIWGYELPWNQVSFSAQAFVCLEKKHLDRKWLALQSYKSQLELYRQYFSWEFTESLARVRGTQISVEYAEAFEIVRLRWQ